MSIAKDALFVGSATRQRKRFRLILILTVTAAFFFFSYNFRHRVQFIPSIPGYETPAGSTIKAPSTLTPAAGTCNVDTGVVDRYGLSGAVKYNRREIFVEITDKEATPITTQMDLNLFDAEPMALVSNGATTSNCSEPITVKVPPSLPFRDASHIDFAISTNMERLMDSMDAFSVWAGYTNTRFLVFIEPGVDQRKAQRKAKSLGLNVELFESTVDYENRYSLLVKLLADNARPQTRWFCIMDDDTFFLSMPRLLQMLEKYDDTQPHYVGTVTESDSQLSMFGIFAYGGAGMFFSRPLMDELGQIWDECDAGTDHGDGKIAHCVYQYSHSKLEMENGLNQLDLMSDASGWFEAARSIPVSLHHWKSWFMADVVKMTAVREVCGTNCILRQWRFADGWVLTNGFSVIHHGASVTDEHGAFAMEKTWDDLNGSTDESFVRTLGPLRGREFDKISFRLEDVVLEGGQVRQIYIRRVEGGDEVLELVWRLN
jgi:Fringe-like